MSADGQISCHKNPGVTFDADHTTSCHIINICQVSFYHIMDIYRTHIFFTMDMPITVANALVNSHLDYCNKTCCGLNKVNTAKLQRVQNSFCQVVCQFKIHARINALLFHQEKLHCLRIQEQTQSHKQIVGFWYPSYP